MAGIATLGAVDMTPGLASGAGTIMATYASSQHLSVINLGRTQRTPGDESGMTGFAHFRSR